MTTPTAPNPWSYESETVGYEPAGQPVLDAFEPASPQPRYRTPILIAAVVVVALILGGGAYAGARLWYGGGAQPEDAAPSTVVAFARLDLSPGLGQKLKVNNLLRKFPREGRGDSVDELKAGIFEAFDVSTDAYRAHVQPWFAERIGVGAWLGGSSRQPYALIVLASHDDAKARAGLAEIQRKRPAGMFGFVVRDRHALVAAGEKDAQAAVELAAKDADRETLAASEAFRRGADWLAGPQTAIAWADLGRVRDAMGAASERFMEESGSGLLMPGLAGFPLGTALQGQLIVGLRATDNGAEIRFRCFGTGAAAEAGDARSTVDALPSESVMAGAFRAGDLASQLPEGMFTPPDLDELLTEELLKDLPPGEAEKMRKQMRDANERAAAIGKAISSLTGATVTVAVSGIDGNAPALAASADVAAGDKAATLADALKVFGDDVTVTTNGTRVELKTKGYQAGDGALAGRALYRETLAGGPDRPSTVVYIDVQRLLADQQGMNIKERGRLAPVKAIGFTVGAEGGDPVGLIRIVIR